MNGFYLVMALFFLGNFRQVASLMLGENVQIGIPGFGQRFRIQCQPPRAKRELLLQYSLHTRMLESPPIRITLNSSVLRYQQVGVQDTKQRLLSLFDLLDDLAVAIKHA